MIAIFLLHILPGLTGIISGAVALFAAKGAWLHRKSGLIFVVAMLVMATSGATMGVLTGALVSVIAGMLTFYLVTSAWLTIRTPAVGSRWLDLGALLLAVSVVVVCVYGLVRPAGADGALEAMYVVFGGVALLAVFQDVGRLRSGSVSGPARLRRHLWRMCLALFVAAGSFFLGQPQVFPEPLRSSGLLALPVLLVLVLMVYWLICVSVSKRYAPA